MIGATIVFAVAVALVATYMFTVNRILRTDEHWSESNMEKAPREIAAPVYRGVTASPAHA